MSLGSLVIRLTLSRVFEFFTKKCLNWTFTLWILEGNPQGFAHCIDQHLRCDNVQDCRNDENNCYALSYDVIDGFPKQSLKVSSKIFKNIFEISLFLYNIPTILFEFFEENPMYILVSSIGVFVLPLLKKIFDFSLSLLFCDLPYYFEVFWVSGAYLPFLVYSPIIVPLLSQYLYYELIPYILNIIGLEWILLLLSVTTWSVKISVSCA